MLNSIQTYFLTEIESTWKSLSENMQPNGVWIAEFEFVPNDYYGQILENKLLLNAWFLDSKGISKKDVMEYKRFMSVHSLFEGLTIPRKSNRVFEIGLSEFAKYENTNNQFYCSFQFGGLFGRGYKYYFDESNKLIRKIDVWVS